VYCAWIIALFVLDRERNARPSKALWIALAWLLINGSRPVSQWLQIGPPVIHSPDSYLDGSPFDAAVFGLLLGAGAIVLIGRGQRAITILRANLPVVWFFCYCALSTLWSDYTLVASKRWIKATGDVVMVLLVLTDSRPLLALKHLLTRAAFVLLPLSVLLIKYYPEMARGYNPWTWLPAYTGVTTGKNQLGMICLVFGLVCLWRFWAVWQELKGWERTRRLVAYGSVIASAIWLLWTCDSMTSTSCLILAGCVMSVVTFTKLARKPLMIHLLVVLVVAISVAALFLDTGGAALQAMGRDSSLTGRTGIWVVVLGIVRHPWIGTGFESFWLGDRLTTVWVTYGNLHIQEAHNGYLEIYLNLGWIGVAFLAVLIASGYRNVMLALRREPEMGRLRLGLFVAAVLYSLTEAGFRMLSPIWFVFLLATFTIPVVTDVKRRPLVGRSAVQSPRSARLEKIVLNKTRNWV